MPRAIIMDELHIRVGIPVCSTPAAQAAVGGRMVSNRFRRQVVRTVRAWFAHLPAPAVVRVRLVRWHDPVLFAFIHREGAASPRARQPSCPMTRNPVVGLPSLQEQAPCDPVT
jgi:hypothetical protein